MLELWSRLLSQRRLPRLELWPQSEDDGCLENERSLEERIWEGAGKERKEVKGERGSGGNSDSLKEAGKGCEKMRLHAGLKLSRLACTMPSSVKNLGGFCISVFKFDRHNFSVVKLSFYQLRIIARVITYLPPKDLERVMDAFITSQLDCCNSSCVVLNQSSIQRLQLVQNVAACFLTGTRRKDHITSVTLPPLASCLLQDWI